MTFKNVDLTQIDPIEILFDNSDTGALYIDSVELY